jgi:hypothetical protein
VTGSGLGFNLGLEYPRTCPGEEPGGSASLFPWDNAGFANSSSVNGGTRTSSHRDFPRMPSLHDIEVGRLSYTRVSGSPATSGHGVSILRNLDEGARIGGDQDMLDCECSFDTSSNHDHLNVRLVVSKLGRRS